MSSSIAYIRVRASTNVLISRRRDSVRKSKYHEFGSCRHVGAVHEHVEIVITDRKIQKRAVICRKQATPGNCAVMFSYGRGGRVKSNLPVFCFSKRRSE